MSDFDNDTHLVGQTFAHPKADASFGQQPAARTSLIGHCLGGAGIGALVGLGLGAAFAPALTSTFLIGGAMTGAALRVGLILLGASAAQDALIASHQEADALKEQEFQARYRAANESGAMERWTKPD